MYLGTRSETQMKFRYIHLKCITENTCSLAIYPVLSISYFLTVKWVPAQHTGCCGFHYEAPYSFSALYKEWYTPFQGSDAKSSPCKEWMDESCKLCVEGCIYINCRSQEVASKEFTAGTCQSLSSGIFEEMRIKISSITISLENVRRREKYI